MFGLEAVCCEVEALLDGVYFLKRGEEGIGELKKFLAYGVEAKIPGCGSHILPNGICAYLAVSRGNYSTENQYDKEGFHRMKIGKNSFSGCI